MTYISIIALLTLDWLPSIMMLCSDPNSLTINFTNQGLTQVNEALFRNCNPGAKVIDLSGNDITRLSADSFAFFDSNTNRFIQQFYGLETLILNDNKISDIDLKTFSFTSNLKTLSLNDNKMTMLQSGIFDSLSNMKNLYISANEINTIGMSVFTKQLYSLRVVDLSGNNLTTVEPWPYIPPSIITFNLSHNIINKFTNRLNWTYDLSEPYHAYVDLKYNDFTIWDDKWFRQYQKQNGDFVGDFVTYRLDITKNKWMCDCHMHYMASKIQDSFYRYADSELLHVDCENPPNLRRTRIMEVDLNKLICNVTLDCPIDCKCQNRSEINVLNVDCSNGNMTQFPLRLPNIPGRLIHLDVSNNNIRQLNSRPYVDKLSQLKAQNNKLVYIDQETMKNMTQADVSVNISNNQLQFLPNSIQTIRTISIYNNPFKCDCNMTWMAGWLGLNTILSKDKQVTCKTDEGVTHKIIDVTDSLLDCNYDTEIGLAVGFGLILIIVVIGIVWAKKCPYETKVLLFKFLQIHPSDKYKVDQPKDDGSSREYDIYVSFDDTNVHIRQWVTRKLKKRLEVKEDAPKYRIFIPIIHLPPGHDQAETIVQTMENSKRIVIILSDKYDENEWSVFECQQAEMLTPNEGRIIFIKYHPEADEMVLKEPWQSRVKDRKVLSIGEKSSEHRWFWDKLRYELPVK